MVDLNLLPNIIAGGILVLLSGGLLGALVIKGVRTGTYKQYWMVYLILVNIVVVWLVQFLYGLLLS